MKTIGTCLWFDHQAEEAAAFYVSVFKDSKVLETTRYPAGMPFPAGSVMTVRFVLDGEEFTALNGGPMYTFTPAISFVASCDTQEKVDYLWERLTEGGAAIQCGWLVDRYGVSWQVVPETLDDMLSSADAAAAQRTAKAMLSMIKLDMAALQRAYDGV